MGNEPEKRTERCTVDVGSRPYWMSPDQYDPCRCKRPAGHELPHACDHENAELLPAVGAIGETGQP